QSGANAAPARRSAQRFSRRSIPRRTPAGPVTGAITVLHERYRWRQMSATTEAFDNYQVITNETGRVFRVGEEPGTILGHGRWVPITAAWLAMCLAGLLEYTWGALNGSLAA